MKPGAPGLVVSATNLRIACFVGVLFQDGRGSAATAAPRAQQVRSRAAARSTALRGAGSS
jgi:hypothetical protein